MRQAHDRQAEIESLGPWFHNVHLPDGSQTAPGHRFGDFPQFKWDKLERTVPKDLSGWSILDIGCNAGFYSLQLANRGAHVLGLEIEPLYLRQAQWIAHEYELTDRLEFVEGDVYQLINSNRKFDLVWFTGVFYHLRYPTLALDLVRRASTRYMMFQSMTMPGTSKTSTPEDLPLDAREAMLQEIWPKMAFIEHRVAGDESNWWAPNAACVEALLRSAGFDVLARPDHEFYWCQVAPIPKPATGDLRRLAAAANSRTTPI
ncbi:MAG: TIGR04290 family methyltransferase [Povalibacter sp.]